MIPEFRDLDVFLAAKGFPADPIRKGGGRIGEAARVGDIIRRGTAYLGDLQAAGDALSAQQREMAGRIAIMEISLETAPAGMGVH
jgi:hypothetical protein